MRENMYNLIDLEDVVEFKCRIKWAKIILWLLNNEVFIFALMSKFHGIVVATIASWYWCDSLFFYILQSIFMSASV